MVRTIRHTPYAIRKEGLKLDGMCDGRWDVRWEVGYAMGGGIYASN